MEPQTIEFVGAPCGQHGPYTFYKAFKFSLNHKYRILSLGEFFFVKISENAPVAIGELQLLWEDKNNESVYMTSVRLYFLPEHTPEGRQEYHGQDEILAENEKFVLRVEDLCQWITENVVWPIGAKAVGEDEIKEDPEHADLTKLFKANNCGLELTDVTKEKELIGEDGEAQLCNVTILSYSRYVRYRSIMKRLEGVSSSWLKNAIVSAIGGFTAPVAGTRIVFCRDTFDHPDLLTHDFRQDHLAPNLKGRPRKKKMKQKRDMESDSNDSDFTPGKEERAIPKPKEGGEHKIRRQVLRPNKDKVTPVEQQFIKELMAHMKHRKTPIDRIPSLGFKQIDLYYFYNYAQKLGGYEQITQRRLWKHLYDRLGGNPGSTSAATCTRRHYERLLLSYERFQKGEKDIDLPLHDDDDDDDNGTDDSKNNDLGDSDNNYSPQNDITELDSILPIPDNNKPDPILPQQPQKTVLSEQSQNHIKTQHIDLTQGGAKRLDSKENGVSRHDPLPPVAARPQPQGIPGVQGEPNMVMVVSKNGEMIRAHRGAPSIMTPTAKPRQNVTTGPKGPPPALIGPFINQPGMQPQLLGQGYHHNNLVSRPGMPPVSYHHLQQQQQKQQQHSQAQQQQKQQQHSQAQQQQQHSQAQQQQKQQQHSQAQQQQQHHNNHQLSRHHAVSSTKGSLRGPSIMNNGPGVRYMGQVKHVHHAHVPAHSAGSRPHSVGNPHDPNRPSVIQHTQLKPEICIPPPARHSQTVFGPPHLRPGAQPPTTAGMKRGYPFSPSTSPRLETPPPTPPSAHNSRHNPSNAMYFPDLDPYAKRPHRHGMSSSSPVPGMAPVMPYREPVNHKVSEDEPTDLSIKKHKHTPQLNSNNYHQHNHSQGSAAAEEGPLNLVMHKRSRDTAPLRTHQHPQSTTTSSSSSTGLHGHTSRPPSIVTNSHLALPFDNNPSSKVPKDMNSATVRTASPRTLSDTHRSGGGLLPHHHSAASSHPASHIISPLSLHQAQKLTAGPPMNHGVPRLPQDHPWNTPGAATPVTASADFAAALLHPAFPQLVPHIMPGLLPPNIPPHVFYEAQLRATHSATGPTPTTDSSSQRPSQMVLSPIPQSPVNYRK